MKKATSGLLALALFISAPIQALALDLDKEISKQNKISSGVVIALNNRKPSSSKLKVGSSYSKDGYQIKLIRKRR